MKEFQEKDDGGKKRQLTPEQLESRRKKGILMLSRSRVQKDLQASQNQRHRDQLNRALADLDAQLAALS